jgi:hypothetical protein
MTSKFLIAVAAVGLSFASATYANAEGLWNATAPSTGQEGGVVSPNSMPPGFMNGTEAALHEQTLARWYNSQNNHAFAEMHTTQPNG